MLKQLSLEHIPPENQGNDEQLPTQVIPTSKPQTAFKALRQHPKKAAPKDDDAALQEAKEKTSTIMEIAKTHPNIHIESGRLPSGYIVSYHLKGGSIMSKHESETEFVQLIKRAIPADLRNKHEYIRSTLTRELDKLTVWVGQNFRFCPVKNIYAVIDIFDNANTGIGKKEISISTIIDELIEHKDDINAKAEELGIAERIDTREKLETKIYFRPRLFDISFDSPAMGIDTEKVSKIKSEMEKDFKVEIEGDLRERMKQVLETLSKSLKTIKKSKNGKMNKRTHDSLIRNMEQIENLNITESEELKTMVSLSKALTEALTSKDMRTQATAIDATTSKTPEQIFADAFRESAPAAPASGGDNALNSLIEESHRNFSNQR